MTLSGPRLLNAGDYHDPETGVRVSLTWDQQDECWRLWRSVHGRYLRVPGENLGSDKTDEGVNEVVDRTVAVFERMVDEAIAADG